VIQHKFPVKSPTVYIASDTLKLSANKKDEENRIKDYETAIKNDFKELDNLAQMSRQQRTASITVMPVYEPL
jgi:hypothetical protein